MFQLKNFVSIAASMLNYVRSTTGKVTDLQPGSVTRTILEAPATEIEELYVQMFNGIREAIPVAVYSAIKFEPLPAQYASGRVTVTSLASTHPQIAIPAGTSFLTNDGRSYRTQRDAIWPADQQQTVLAVISAVTGVSQNAAADQIATCALFPPDRFLLNSSEMDNGADAETEANRRTRFAEYIAALSRGTEAAIIYAAKNTSLKDINGFIIEGVVRTAITSTPGAVTLYVWGSSGEPSQALLEAITLTESGYRDDKGNVYPGYRAAGIQLLVKPMRSFTVSPSAKVTLESDFVNGTDLSAALTNALNSRLYNVLPGQTITVEEMRMAMLAVPGVLTIELSGVNNVICGEDQVLVAGTVAIV